MASQIDPSKPTEGQAFTADVRTNFATAASEIGALQDEIVALQGNAYDYSQRLNALENRMTGVETSIADLKAQIANMRDFTTAGVWSWIPSAQDSAPATGKIGYDTDDPAQAANIVITNQSKDGTDFHAYFLSLEAGDQMLLVERRNSANLARWTLTGPPNDHGGAYFTIPVALDELTGVEPANLQDVTVSVFFKPAT